MNQSNIKNSHFLKSYFVTYIYYEPPFRETVQYKLHSIILAWET